MHFPAAYGHIHRRDISSLCVLTISCARARLFRALAACQPAPPGARKISAPKNPTISAQRPLLRIPGINSVFPLCRYSSLRFRLQTSCFSRSLASHTGRRTIGSTCLTQSGKRIQSGMIRLGHIVKHPDKFALVDRRWQETQQIFSRNQAASEVKISLNQSLHRPRLS